MQTTLLTKCDWFWCVCKNTTAANKPVPTFWRSWGERHGSLPWQVQLRGLQPQEGRAGPPLRRRGGSEVPAVLAGEAQDPQGSAQGQPGSHDQGYLGVSKREMKSYVLSNVYFTMIKDVCCMFSRWREHFSAVVGIKKICIVGLADVILYGWWLSYLVIKEDLEADDPNKLWKVTWLEIAGYVQSYLGNITKGFSNKLCHIFWSSCVRAQCRHHLKHCIVMCQNVWSWKRKWPPLFLFLMESTTQYKTPTSHLPINGLNFWIGNKTIICSIVARRNRVSACSFAKMQLIGSRRHLFQWNTLCHFSDNHVKLTAHFLIPVMLVFNLTYLWRIKLCSEIAQFGMSFSIVFKKCILICGVLFSIDLQAWQASKTF